MIRRLLAFLDRHLTDAGLLPRRKPDGLDLRLAHSGRPVAVDALSKWRETRTIETAPHCLHCRQIWAPADCPLSHPTACPECEDGAA